MDFIKDFGINPIVMTAYLVNFLILFFVLNKFVFQPALKNMESRRKMTEDLVKNSQSTQIALDNAKSEFEKIVIAANTKAQEIVNKSNDSAKSVAEEIKHKAEEQAKLILEKAQEEIDLKGKAMRKELEKYVGELVAETVEKILGDLPESQKNEVMKNIDKKLVR